MKTISLNGKDGSGKSQQIRLLTWNNENLFHATKPLSTYSSRWPKLHGYDMSQWWFEKVPIKELIEIIVEALNIRHLDRVGGKITAHDRGYRMFKAVCVATKLTREPGTVDEAVRVVDECFSSGLDHATDEVEVFFRPNPEYFSKVKPLASIIRPKEDVGFPESARIRYARYQEHLRAAMGIYFSHPRVHSIEVREPILDIHNKLRVLVNELFDLKLPYMGSRIDMMVGFGGLSESGKSSFAENLRQHHGFLRLKLKYFIELLERRGATRSPESVVLELLQFLDSLPYNQRVSCESLHDPFIPAMLKLMLGDRCKIVFIETSEDIRVSRGAQELHIDMNEARKIVAKKDSVKRGRGAEKVREFADIIFDNSQNDHRHNLETFSDLLNIK